MMTRCLQLMVFLFFSSVICAQAPPVEQWDILRCVDYALKNNISVRQTDLQSRFSALTYSQSKSARLPSLNYGASGGFSFGRSENPVTGVVVDNNFFSTRMDLQSQVSLFNWFSQRNTIEANRLNWEADKEQTNKLKNDIALNVAAAYLQILLAKEQVRVAELQVTQTEIQLENTRKRVDAGALPELNAAELEAQLARDNSNHVAAQTSVQQFILQMKALLNLDAATPFDVVTPSVDKIPVESLADLQPDKVYTLAIATMPQQKVNTLRIQSAQKSVAAAKAGLYPTISAFAGLNTSSINATYPTLEPGPFGPTGAVVVVNGNNLDVLAPTTIQTGDFKLPLWRQYRTNFGQNIGLSLSVPIFNGHTARTAWNRSKLNVKNLELQKEQGEMQLKQDIYTAYNDAVAALEQFNANKKTEETSFKAYEFAQKRYEVNLLSVYDLNNSRNSYRTARIQTLYAQYDYLFKIKVLEFYKGQGIRL